MGNSFRILQHALNSSTGLCRTPKRLVAYGPLFLQPESAYHLSWTWAGGIQHQNIAYLFGAGYV